MEIVRQEKVTHPVAPPKPYAPEFNRCLRVLIRVVSVPTATRALGHREFMRQTLSSLRICHGITLPPLRSRSLTRAALSLIPRRDRIVS
jgi:hypothetical protein